MIALTFVKGRCLFTGVYKETYLNWYSDSVFPLYEYLKILIYSQIIINIFYYAIIYFK